MMFNITNLNNTVNNINIISDYDRNGAIIYTVVTLLFYSLSLFCSLILNIDPDDHYDVKTWSIYESSQNKRTFHSSQADILNTLSNQSLRQKYWRIYYGNDEYESRSHKFCSAELKRLSIVSHRMKELNNQQIKQSNKHKERNELNRMTLQPSPDPSPSSFLHKFRQSRSTSIPAVLYYKNSLHRSYDVLCETPLSKPPSITLTEYS